jgi:hypothetical protein
MRLWLVIAVSLLANLAYSQEFVAVSNARTVVEGSTFTIKFELRNGRGSNFRAPDFGSLQVLSGPNTSTSTTIINGQVSSSYSMSYTLMASKKGVYTIGPASINVGRDVLRSNSLRVKVVEGTQASGEEDLFVRAELDRDTAYVGQQVVLSLKLYSRVNVERFDELSQPQYDDIFVKNLPRFSRRSSIEVVNGVQYTTQILRRIALFPQKSGKFDLGSYVIRLGIPDPSQRRTGFFFTTRLQSRDVRTNEVSFEVFTLPRPKPVSFSGGIGKYEVQMKSDRTRLSTDDALSLTVTIQGDGDERGLSAPDLNLGEDFETYDANELSSRSSPTEDRDVFTKNFEYLIVPKKAGSLWLAPEFSFFDPDSMDYQTVIIDSLLLEVRQGTAESDALRKFKENRKVDFLPLMTTFTPHKKRGYVLSSPLYWGGWSILILAAVGLLWVRRRQLIDEALDPEQRRFMRARKAAEKRLEQAKAVMGDTGSNRFYEELALGIKTYLGDKLALDPAQFTRQNLTNTLTKAGMADETITEITTLLNDCDLALFATGFQPDRQASYQRALDIIARLEEGLKA